MPQVSGLEQKLRSIRETFKQGSLETQDSAINELHNALEDSSDSLFPSLFYPPCINVLTYYCQALLPNLSMSVEDRQCIQRGFERSVDRLHTQEQHVKNLEAQINRFFLQVRGGQFDTAADLVTAFTSVISAAQKYREAHIPLYDGSEDKMFPVKELEKQYRTLKKSPFTAKHVRPFFETLIHNAFSHQCKEQFEWMQSLFWNSLNDLLQMKAVLVNTLTKKALITSLDVETRLEPSGLDELDFENRVNERMYLSCWNALQAARDFLEQHFPDILKECSIHVLCRFPNPAAEYNDASASLLVGLKVVGDVLDMQIDPQVLVSGEVDEAGRILPVNHVAAKLRAAERHPAIQQLYLPEDGLYVKNSRITVVKVRAFSEIIEYYYGEQLQQKAKELSRRQILIKVPIMIAAIPIILKDIFTYRVAVTDMDLWSLEYAEELYRKHSDYQKATEILETILKKFQKNSTTKALHIKAQAFDHLGWIYSQQNQKNESLRLFHRAFSLCKSIHDIENQAKALWGIGAVYHDTVGIDGITKNTKLSLKYLAQANEILKPSMKTFNLLRGECYGEIGCLYRTLDKNEMARQYLEKSTKILAEADSNDWYHSYRQHLGRVYIRLGKYDEAFDIIQETSNSPALQTPWFQMKNFSAWCELFLSLEEYEKGLQFAKKAAKLSKEIGGIVHYPLIQKMLVRHQLPPSILDSL